MALNISTIYSFIILVALFLCSDQAHVSDLVTSQQPSTGSFSVDLINREFSPLSPFYNPQATHFDRLHNVINRSISRLNHLQSKSKSSSGEFESTLQYNDQEYLMKLKIGTPPVETLLLADTGSDLTWLQCKPCENCFKHIYPLFDFRKSSTYKTLKCTSKYCVQSSSVYNTTCNTKRNKCQYSNIYVTGMSSGDLATEKLTFEKSWIENFRIGCRHNNNGIFSNISSGVFGLAGGPLSITNQLDDIIGGKFSYCMAPIFKNETSRIVFGEESQIDSPKAVSTPLFMFQNKSAYYLNLEKVIIGNKSFEFEIDGEKTKADQDPLGNIVIDSGTTFTYLPSGKFYDGIISALKEYIGAKTVPNKEFDLCYKYISKSKVPLIAFQFTGGAIWKIPTTSAFIEIDHGVTCLAVIQLNLIRQLLIFEPLFGNMFQQNYLVSYDLHGKKLSFQATDCTKIY